VTTNPITPETPMLIAGGTTVLRTRHATVVAACPPGSLAASGAMGFVTDFTQASAP